MRETKTVEQVFIESLQRKLDDRLVNEEHYLAAGIWDTLEQGKARVAVIKVLKELEQDFTDVYAKCFGQ